MSAAQKLALEKDRDSIAQILDELSVGSGDLIERSRLRRIVEDVAAAWPGSPADRWTVWVVEAGHSLGRAARVVDCSPRQAVELAHHGASVLTRLADSSWLALVGGDSSKVMAIRPGQSPATTSISRRKAAKQLEQLLGTREARFVVLDSTSLQAADHGAGHDAHHASPLDRYWSILRPESLDILTVLAFSVVTGLLAMAVPLAVETLVSTVAFGRLLQPVVVLALMLLGVLTFSAAIRGLQIFVIEIMQRRLFARITASLAFRLPRSQVESLEHHYAPELVNRFFEVVTVQKVTAGLLLDGITLVVSALIGMSVLAIYHPWLLGFDLVLLSLMTFAIFVLGRRAVSSSIEESLAKYRTASWLEDIAACPTAFRYHGATEFAMERADRHIFDYLKARRRHFRVLFRQMLFALVLQALASTALLGLGGWLVISGQLTLGQLVAAELIVAVIVGSFTKLGKHLESYYDVMASMDKLGHLFDIPVERQDGQVALPGLVDGISLKATQVAYHYPDGQTGLLPLDWTVERGQRWAVTGRDGSGKSTLLDLAFGLRRPSQGVLTMNGISPRELRPDAIRRHTALARGIEIFAGTIAENIHLQRPELALSDVYESLELVGLLEEIHAMPSGVETPLITGEGRPLSGGQLLKLMIARATIGRPQLLLIDGTLDALPDEEAEAIVRRLLDPGRPWTLVLATSRQSIANLFPKRLHLEKPTARPAVLGLEARHAH